MHLTKEQLDDITEFAGYFYEPDKIEIIIELEFGTITNALTDDKSEIYKAYYKGFLKADATLRKNMIETAKNGSHQAQLELLKISNRLKNILDG